MVQAIGWLLKILVFLVVLGFALKNSQPVTLHYFFDYAWEAPLVFVLLVGVALGAMLGILALLPLLFRLRLERGKLLKQVKASTQIPAEKTPANIDTLG